MKDYKRLTIRNDDGTWGVNYLELSNEVVKWQEQHATQYLSTDLTNILGEKLADLEDIIENHDLDFKKRGKWIYTERGCVITCSYCGERLELCHPDGTEIRWSKHCPSCGALMDEIGN